MPKPMPADFEPQPRRENRNHDCDEVAEHTPNWVEFSKQELVRYGGFDAARAIFNSGARTRGFSCQTRVSVDDGLYVKYTPK